MNASFQTRLALGLLAFQLVLWVVVVPWSFYNGIQALKQVHQPELGGKLEGLWGAARAAEDLHREWRDLPEWRALTDQLAGTRQAFQAEKSFLPDTAVRELRGLLWLALVQLVGLTVTAVLAARTLSRQVRQIYDAVVRLRRGDRTTRFPELSGREFRLLGTEFNRLMDSLEEHEARLGALGRLLGWQETARFLSHQIKNPLTALGLASKNLETLGALESPLARQNAEVLRIESERLLHLVKRLEELTSFDTLLLERLDLAGLAAEVALRSFPVPLSLVWQGPRPFFLAGDRILLEQVFLNLMLNSAQAAERQPVEVTVTITGREVWFHDSLSGFDAGLPSRFFGPPFTTKETGTGLGLIFCRRILQLHGGDLAADLNGVGGLCFKLTFGEEAYG